MFTLLIYHRLQCHMFSCNMENYYHYMEEQQKQEYFLINFCEWLIILDNKFYLYWFFGEGRGWMGRVFGLEIRLFQRFFDFKLSFSIFCFFNWNFLFCEWFYRFLIFTILKFLHFLTAIWRIMSQETPAMLQELQTRAGALENQFEPGFAQEKFASRFTLRKIVVVS